MRKRMNKRGEIGIGALIIFIAMVLVAAIAAAVLISAANEMSMQAFATSKAVRKGVSSGLDVVHVYGNRTNGESGEIDTNGTIENLTIVVKLRPGSDPIDLNRVVVRISDGERVVDFSYFSGGTNEDAADMTPYYLRYNATCLMDPDEHDVFAEDDILTEGTLVSLTFDCSDWLAQDGDGGGGNTNAPGAELYINTQQKVTIKLIPKHGVPTLIKFTTPSTYSDENIVEFL